METNLKVKKGFVILTVNPKIYPLETVYSAAYTFLDKAYILLDGDPKKEIIVKLKPKERYDLKKLGFKFFDELINYADYRSRAEQTRGIREMLLQRALITNDPSIVQNDEYLNQVLKEVKQDKGFDDAEGIAIPWEDRNNKGTKKKYAKKKK